MRRGAAGAGAGLSPAAVEQAAVAGLLRWSSGYDAGAPEILPLADALGRSLATDVPAPVSLPPFDNSQMDGYAVHAADLEDPSHLAVTDAIARGELTTDTDVESLVEMLVAVMWGMGFYAGFVGDHDELKSVVQQLELLMANKLWRLQE